MLNIPLVAVVNHVLAAETWARERLQPHAGKRVHLRAGLLDAHVAIGPDGLLQSGRPDGDATLRLSVPVSAWFALIRRDQTAMRAVEVEGDTDLAETLQFLFLHCRWDVEEDLSKFVGDIAAHRIVAGGQALMAWQRDSATRLGESLAEYWREDAGLLATKGEVSEFVGGVSALRDDIERLEKQLQRRSNG